MTEHARFFPASGSPRWILCPGSVKLCDGLPDDSSAYAEEGTLAHEIAAQMLQPDCQTVDTDEMSEELFEAVVSYVEFVKRLAQGNMLFVEERVDFSKAIGQEDGSGTADAIIIGQGEATIVDLKTGRIKAHPIPQLGLYVVGALEKFAYLGPFERVRLVIHQSRIDHVEEVILSMTELEAFVREASAAAAEAMSDEPRFTPGEKQCRFCKAKAHCPALAAKVAEVIGQEFENLDAGAIKSEPDRIGLNYLARCMASVSLVEDWCKGIRARVERELLDGNQVEGYKLVQGRKGARKWTSDDEAEAALRKMKLKVEEIYDLKVISPTSAEKLAKAGTIGPRQWPQLQQLITQSEGSISVAPASDKRPAVTPGASAADFETIT